SRLDISFFDGGKSSFLAVKNAGGSPECTKVVTSNLQNAAFWSNIALQNDKTTRRLKRSIELSHDFLFWRFFRRHCFFGKCAPSDGQGVAVQQLGLKQSLGDERSAASRI